MLATVASCIINVFSDIKYFKLGSVIEQSINKDFLILQQFDENNNRISRQHTTSDDKIICKEVLVPSIQCKIPDDKILFEVNQIINAKIENYAASVQKKYHT